MSNSPLVTYQRLTNACTAPRWGKIQYITIHCYVGQVTAKQGCDYFATSGRSASANYVVGKDGSIGLCVDEKNRAWTSGGIYSVNGITGKLNDHSAVTIEVASDTVHPYAVTDAAYNSLIKLVADIAKRNGMGELKWRADKSLVGRPGLQNMTVHRWFDARVCPGDYLYSRMGDIATKANQINKEEADMTRAETEKLIRELVPDISKQIYMQLRANEIAERSEAHSAPWAKPFLEKVIANGLMGDAGEGEIDRPLDYMTRQEEAVTLSATIDMVEKKIQEAMSNGHS